MCLLSDSDSDFEKFIENRKKRKKSIFSADEAKNRTKKQQGKRPPKLKERRKQDQDKENLLDLLDGDQEMEEGEEEEVEVLEVPKPAPRFKPRPSTAEQGILEGFVEEGLDREDVKMFKLALARLKGEGNPLVEGLPWAHYPHNIL